MGRTPNRREVVVVAAAKLFAARGYGAVTLGDIADEIGWTKAGVFYHFRYKHELLAAIAEPLLEDAERLVSARGADRLDVLAGYLDLMLEHRVAVQVLVSAAAEVMATDLAPRLIVLDGKLVAALARPSRSLDTKVRAEAALAVARTVTRWSMTDRAAAARRDRVFDAAVRALG